jgi:glycosyltransferase involved in cell wall biosynthesis
MVLSDFPDQEAGRRPQAGPQADDTFPVRPMLSYKPVSAALAIAPTVSVIIPARNEGANLPHVFASLPAWVDEIIVVDGHSVDDTVAVTRAVCPRARVIAQSGRGKGDALQAGFTAATGDIIVSMDADGSTDGAEIIQFVGALVAGADFAKGSRFSGSGGSDDITVSRRYGNRLLGMLVNRMFRTQFTDLCYGYNAFWTHHLSALRIDCPGFEVETLMNIRAAKAGLRIQEIPSFERPRLHGESNLSAIGDGWRILRLIAQEKFSWLHRGGTATVPRPVSPARPGTSQAAKVSGKGA